MIRISELKYKYVPKLMDVGIERDEAVAEFELVVKTLSNCSGKELLLDIEIDNETEKQIISMLEKRIATGAPIQYILGKAYFMGCEYFLNSETLIPRPETEILVTKVVELLNFYNKETKVLDIGTGSGCIACAIAKNINNVEVIGVDISTTALQAAIKNAEQLNVIKKAMFRKSDFFSNVSEKFDIIVSNPPYIPIQQKGYLQKEVQFFEPERALFTQDEEGLEFYIKIVEEAHNYLNLEGFLVFEIGDRQAEKVESLLVHNSFTVKDIIKDLNGIQRVIVAQID